MLRDNDYSPIVRYFILDDIDKNQAILMPDGDLLPLDRFTSVMEHGTLDDGRKIGSILFNKKMVALVYEQTGQTELNATVLEYFHLTSSFAGRTPAEVKTVYPEMAQIIYTIDDEGNEIATPRFRMVRWATQYYEVTE